MKVKCSAFIMAVAAGEGKVNGNCKIGRDRPLARGRDMIGEGMLRKDAGRAMRAAGVDE